MKLVLRTSWCVWTKYRCYFHCLLNFTLDQLSDISPRGSTPWYRHRHLDQSPVFIFTRMVMIVDEDDQYRTTYSQQVPFGRVSKFTPPESPLVCVDFKHHCKGKQACEAVSVLYISQKSDHLANTLADVRWWAVVRPWFSGRETAVLWFRSWGRSRLDKWTGPRKSRPC